MKSADVLGIVKAGFEAGEVYVELENGLRFYGLLPLEKNFINITNFYPEDLKKS
ncbi:MAG: hypothetical protein U5K00_07290 [Melioribacteraceae bacterium]|nr:hypothetical protein [Melioribacteraceae bacterium]